MKRFQSETDALTKRAKAAESAFHTIYKTIANAPDPTPLLESALSSQKQTVAIRELEIENEKLQATIKEYRTDFADIKNQEVTIKRLQDKIDALESDIEATVSKRVAEKERQLKKDFAEQERELQEQQLEIATKLGEAEQTAATSRDALDTTQSELFDLKSKYDVL